MLLNISELGREPVLLECIVAIAPFSWEGGAQVRSEDVGFSGKLVPTRRGPELHGRLKTVAHVECARCLTPVAVELDRQFRLLILVGAADSDAPLQDDDDDIVDDLFEIEGSELDLKDVLREQIDLALPFRVVCESSESCAPNADNAAHDEDEDGRWDALKNVREALVKKQGENELEAGAGD